MSTDLNRAGVRAATLAFETASVTAARRYMSEVFRSHDLVMPREEAALRMRHEAVKAGRVSLHWLQYGAAVTMMAPEMGGFYLFQFILGGACEIRHRGRTRVVDGGKSYVVHPSEPLAKTWNSECRQLIVKVDRDRFERFASREIGVDVAGRLDFDFDIVPVEAGPRTMIEMAKAVREDAADSRHGLSHPRVSSHLDATMMALMLASFPHRFRERYDRAAEPCAPYYVHRAEDYIRAHLRDPISIEDLVAASDVGARSLFSGFRRFRGLAPMAYVKTLRLELAFDMLKRADPAECSVTQIALACGFSHMSKFARDFAARFGERPGAVLGRYFYRK
ncbi:MAG: helix-turn-helix domain-containing protein [Pseudorhodoplanes sp.]|uniref:AraC-like ligand-binding domain-containing protein n=1 Tax=Pseudorhodoplanes sp. TaxID=1934341 RepID=UPI003D1251C7